MKDVTKHILDTIADNLSVKIAKITEYTYPKGSNIPDEHDAIMVQLVLKYPATGNKVISSHSIRLDEEL